MNFELSLGVQVFKQHPIGAAIDGSRQGATRNAEKQESMTAFERATEPSVRCDPNEHSKTSTATHTQQLAMEKPQGKPRGYD